MNSDQLIAYLLKLQNEHGILPVECFLPQFNTTMTPDGLRYKEDGYRYENAVADYPCILLDISE